MLAVEVLAQTAKYLLPPGNEIMIRLGAANRTHPDTTSCEIFIGDFLIDSAG